MTSTCPILLFLCKIIPDTFRNTQPWPLFLNYFYFLKIILHLLVLDSQRQSQDSLIQLSHHVKCLPKSILPPKFSILFFLAHPPSYPINLLQILWFSWWQEPLNFIWSEYLSLNQQAKPPTMYFALLQKYSVVKK